MLPTAHFISVFDVSVIAGIIQYLWKIHVFDVKDEIVKDRFFFLSVTAKEKGVIRSDSIAKRNKRF